MGERGVGRDPTSKVYEHAGNALYKDCTKLCHARINSTVVHHTVPELGTPDILVQVQHMFACIIALQYIGCSLEPPYHKLQ